MNITKIHSREILDSRGEPTITCTITLSNNTTYTASVPSGASVGTFEAKELRDNDPKRYSGKGVLRAIKNLETVIAPLLIGKKPDVQIMDTLILETDGTPDKSKLGANAILAASIAVIRAQAAVEGLPLYQLISNLASCGKPALPRCMFNVINGGMHADSGLAFQEFMVMPQTDSVATSVECASSLHHVLKKLLHEKNYATSLGDEGGFAPRFTEHGFDKEKAALDLLMISIETVDRPCNFSLCLDVAATSFYDAKNNYYQLHDKKLTRTELVELYSKLCKHYPIVSIEDGLAEEDWSGWQHMTNQLGEKIQIVGDDLFVTNVDRIKRGIEEKSSTAVLIKPNQIGSVSETIKAIQLCKKNKLKVVVSHRSGETSDSFIADLAVGTAAEYFKAGAPARGERVAKYNRLMEIEKELQ